MKMTNKIVSLALCMLLTLGMMTVGSMCASAYAADAAVSGEPAVRVTNSESEVTTGYKETGYFEFEATDLPEGAAVHVYLNGEDRGAETYIYVNDPTEDYTVEAKILDQSGSVIASSGEIQVHVRNGIWDRVEAFLKQTVGSFVDGIADVVASFFVKILFFLFNR